MVKTEFLADVTHTGVGQVRKALRGVELILLVVRRLLPCVLYIQPPKLWQRQERERERREGEKTPHPHSSHDQTIQRVSALSPCRAEAKPLLVPKMSKRSGNSSQGANAAGPGRADTPLVSSGPHPASTPANRMILADDIYIPLRVRWLAAPVDHASVDAPRASSDPSAQDVARAPARPSVGTWGEKAARGGPHDAALIKVLTSFPNSSLRISPFSFSVVVSSPVLCKYRL